MKSPADMKIIQIDITNACGLRCANCTRFCGHHVEPFFMDFETFKKAVDSLKGFRGIVGIMGGEPTLHPEFERFLEYYRANVGYDDFSTAASEPSSDFIRHILANASHVDYSNHRGLFTSVTTRYYEHFELIQDTFGYQLLNDHSNPSQHQTHMVTRKELGIPDEEWFKLRDRCWIQNLWSASITPKGAFFCEVAAAMDATLGGPGGWPIEPGWWERKPADFKDQLHWCEKCSACLRMPTRNANDETDDVSPEWEKMLAEINSPKLRKQLVNTFDPVAYQADEHSLNQEITPYMNDQEMRMGKSRLRLLPQKITHVVQLSGNLESEAAHKLLAGMKVAGQLDAIAGENPDLATVAAALGVPFVSTIAELVASTAAKDWVLMSRDCAPSSAFIELTKTCVFNPGVVYLRDLPGESLQFFNLRAHSLSGGGNLFGIAASYPARKIVSVKAQQKDQYSLSDPGMFLRRASKRSNWLKRKLKGLPVPRGPVGAWKGNKVVGG